MREMEDQELKDLLHELGYDEREYLFEDGARFNRFVKQQDREVLREARAYLDELDDCCEDDYYIRLKNGLIHKYN